MKNLWKVTFDAKYSGVSDMMPESANVICNGDGLKAIAKAKSIVMRRSWEDDEHGCRIRRVTDAKVVELEILQHIDE
jgi:hypothetical protein